MLNNFKVSYSGDKVIVKSKLEKNQAINSWEANFITQKHPRGLMTICETDEKKNEITFMAPSAVSIEKYFANVITAEQLMLIIIQTVELCKRISGNKLFLSNIVFDNQFIVVNQMTNEAYFIYLPVSANNSQADPLQFIKNLILKSRFYIEDKNLQNVVSFITYVGNARVFNAEEMENTLRRICPDLYGKISNIKTNSSGFIADSKLEYINHYNNAEMQQKSSLNSFSENGFANNTISEETYPVQDDYAENNTTLLEDDTPTQLLNEENDSATTVLDEKIPQPYLIRLKNSEKIMIDKPVFKIGKDRLNMDYVVSDNSAVSRNHAQIITRNNRYYIVDNKSTNKTYIDGSPVASETEVELQAQNIVKLGNEEFQFDIEY